MNNLKIIVYSVCGLAILFFLVKILVPESDKMIPSSTESSITDQHPNKILKVPEDFPSISQAVENARDGDWVIIGPGKYVENNIEIKHAITVSSEWKQTDDQSKVDQTIIDAGDKTLFTITADGVEISGLHIVNGNHTLDILAKVNVRFNHFLNNLDALSFEGTGGGYVGFNIIEEDRDDGIDLDIGSNPDNGGSHVLVEHNRIINSQDDGIEVRLFSHPEQNIRYTLRKNTIIGCQNAGIQLISYDAYTGKEFYIHHKIISGCKTGLGCMEGSNSAEHLSGASKMDERVYFFNNTLIGNQMGATGGNNILAFNNLVQDNSLGGFKRFGRNSVIVTNLFFNNGGKNLLENLADVDKRDNQMDVDPLLDKISFKPGSDSLAIDSGVNHADFKTGEYPFVPASYILGYAPDIGAIEIKPKE